MSKPKRSREVSDEQFDKVPEYNYNMAGNPYNKRFSTGVEVFDVLTVNRKLSRIRITAPFGVTRHTIKTRLNYRPFVSGNFKLGDEAQQINGTTSSINIGNKVWIDDIRIGEIDIGTFGFNNTEIELTLFLYHNAIA